MNIADDIDDIEIVKSTSAGCTLPKLDEIFASY